jgi:predicted aldo/keto reductase-like oxidoreductase
MSTGRRTFLKGLGAVIGALGLGAVWHYRSQVFLLRPAPTESPVPRPEWADAHVRSYRPLGRTGWEMSDISFGAGRLDDADVVRKALDRGVNYIDTSPDYSESNSERLVGEAIEGRRDQVFLASKFCTPDGHLDQATPVADIIEAVEASLRRLRTDYLDLCHIHACNSVDRLMAPTFHEAFDRLREQGKVRFLGVSSHTPNLEEVLHHAVDSGRFDVVMAAYNFNNWPDLDSILDKAAARGVGFVAMKTLKGAFHTALSDFTPDERTSFPQAAFKWVNGNPRVSGLVVSMWKPAQIDEYLYASGQTASAEELALLGKYDRLVARRYCRPGCGECLDACPAGLPIDDVLRYSMYYEGYGNEREGIARYAALAPEKTASVCAGCSAPCAGACPFDIPIGERMTLAHRQLSIKA